MRGITILIALGLMALPAVGNAKVPANIYAAQKKMGRIVDSPGTAKFWAPLQPGEPKSVKVTRDIAYGSDPQEKLDVHTSGIGQNKPVLMFVHGGGFTRGDKHRPGAFAYDNIMAWAVAHGFVGININYRLAPKHQYPDANEDLESALRWAKANAARYGGDPNHIFLWGHSAGASLVASYISHPQFHVAPGGGISGAIMTSGTYEVTGPSPYFGKDPATFKERSSLPGLLKTDVPLFVTRAELDPPRIAAQGDKLDKALCAVGKCPTFMVSKGHNHMSQVFSVNTSEHQLTDPILAFMKKHM